MLDKSFSRPYISSGDTSYAHSRVLDTGIAIAHRFRFRKLSRRALQHPRRLRFHEQVGPCLSLTDAASQALVLFEDPTTLPSAPSPPPPPDNQALESRQARRAHYSPHQRQARHGRPGYPRPLALRPLYSRERASRVGRRPLCRRGPAPLPRLCRPRRERRRRARAQHPRGARHRGWRRGRARRSWRGGGGRRDPPARRGGRRGAVGRGGAAAVPRRCRRGPLPGRHPPPSPAAAGAAALMRRRPSPGPPGPVRACVLTPVVPRRRRRMVGSEPLWRVPSVENAVGVGGNRRRCVVKRGRNGGPRTSGEGVVQLEGRGRGGGGGGGSGGLVVGRRLAK
jgi:hypothetical protein